MVRLLSGSGQFAVTLELPAKDLHARANVALFARVDTRSALAPILSGSGLTTPSISSTGSFALSCHAHQLTNFYVGVYIAASRPGSGPCGSHPRLHLACPSLNCGGVYPIRYTVTSNHVTHREWSLLVVQSSRVLRPLQLNWIETVGSRTTSAQSAQALLALGKFPSSALTLGVDYRALSYAMNATGSAAVAWRGALNHALASPLHRLNALPPESIDFAGLAANGFASQVTNQFSLTSDLARTFNGRYLDGPAILSSTPTAADLQALAASGVSNVVLPESALSAAPSTSLSWGTPFHVPGAGSLSALSTDGPLEQLVTDSAIVPGLRATLTAGTLAMLYFEAPNARSPRSVVITAPLERTSGAFLNSFFREIANDPFIRAANLVPSFNSSLIGANGSPQTRTLTPTTASTWSPTNVDSLMTVASAVNSFTKSLRAPLVSETLRVALAQSEIVGSPQEREAAIVNVSGALNTQLQLFSVDPSSITLTGTGSALPITLLSRANYPMRVLVHLVTDRLKFPGGQYFETTLNSPTKAIRVVTEGHGVGSFTLQVVVTTQDSGITLARAAIQVRSTGTSIVGYLLTGGSLAVLALWWWRTLRRRTKGRHAR